MEIGGKTGQQQACDLLTQQVAHFYGLSRALLDEHQRRIEQIIRQHTPDEQSALLQNDEFQRLVSERVALKHDTQRMLRDVCQMLKQAGDRRTFDEFYLAIKTQS